MVKLRYIGAMAKGLAICPGFKIGVEKNTVYDVPLSASKHFLATTNWEKVNIPKEKKKEKLVEEPEVKKSYDNYDEDLN